MTRISRFQFNSSRTTLTLLICIIAFGMVRAFNTVFLSRFSVMDSTPQLRELVKSSFDIKHMVHYHSNCAGFCYICSIET